MRGVNSLVGAFTLSLLGTIATPIPQEEAVPPAPHEKVIGESETTTKIKGKYYSVDEAGGTVTVQIPKGEKQAFPVDREGIEKAKGAKTGVEMTLECPDFPGTTSKTPCRIVGPKPKPKIR